MVKWELDFWENSNGNSPAGRDLDDLRLDKKSRARAMKKVELLQEINPKDLRESKYIEKLKGRLKGLYELKIHVSKMELRILGILKSELVNDSNASIFHALHIFNKKSQKISDKNKQTALYRFQEFKKRNKT